MDKFKLVSKYKPTGDQPQAIDSLVKGVLAGYKEQTLMGVTGSVKPLLWLILLKKLIARLLCLHIIKHLRLSFAVSSENFS